MKYPTCKTCTHCRIEPGIHGWQWFLLLIPFAGWLVLFIIWDGSGEPWCDAMDDLTGFERDETHCDDMREGICGKNGSLWEAK